MNVRARTADLMFDRGGALSLVILAVYLWLAPHYIVDGDNAEFSTLGATGGIAHPPGYPLYVLYLRAMSWLPGGSVAHTAALATAMLGASTSLVLHAACRAWGARPAAASFAVAILAAAPVVLHLHTAAEVFALNDLIAALILWLAAQSGPARGARRACLLAFVAGLGLCNQHTCVMLAPVGLLGVVRGIRESALPRVATIALAIGSFSLGLLPYAYVFVAPQSSASWGSATSLSDLVALFTRADYGGVGAFSAIEGAIHPGANVAAFIATLGRGWLWAPAMVGIAMLGFRSVRPGEGEPRWGWGMLSATFLLAGPILAARFNIEPVGIGLFICQRFHLLAVVLLAVPVAIGIDQIARGVAARTRFVPPRRRAIREAVMVMTFAAAAGGSLPSQLASHSPALERGIVNLLSSLPPRAVVIGIADDLHFGSLYVQAVHALRPDVDVIAWRMTTLPWYRTSFSTRGLAIDPTAPGDEPPSLRIARQVFAAERPLFVEVSLASILQTFPSYPYGIVFRVLPPGTAKPTLDEIVALNRRLFSAFDLAYPKPEPEAAYALEMHVRYARTWDILAQAFAESGRMEEAREANAIARQLGPRSNAGS